MSENSTSGPLIVLLRLATVAALVLAIPLALFTTNVRIAVSQQRVYDYSVREYSAADAAGIPELELLRANAEIRQYLTASHPGPLSLSVSDNEGDLVPLFGARETAHMADVRSLVQSMFTFQALAIIAVPSLLIATLVLWSPRALAAAALCGSLMTIGVLTLAGAAVMTGFDSTWSQFHVVAFSNDLWQLNPATDHLIQMFPEVFWQDMVLLIGEITLAQAILIAGCAAAYLVLSQPRPVILQEPPAVEVAGPAGHARRGPPQSVR